MSRSPLFRTVRRLMRRARGGPPARQDGPSRRDVLRMLGIAAPVAGLAACGDDLRLGGDTSIAIVGGGVAGLTAAHFLALAGVRAEIFEAQMRTGGRMFTQHAAFGDQLCELGGELVDTDHLVIQSLAETFGLQLDDLPVITDGLAQDRFHIGGSVLAESAIVAAFTPVAAKMATATAMGDADEAEFARIDALSIHEWLTQEAGLAANSTIVKLLEVAYLEEFGLEVADQSAWNLITLIDFETPDPFHVFGDSDERFHIHQGSQAIPDAIAATIPDQIHLDHALTKVVARSDGKFELAFTTSGGDATFVADHVVYALPFTRLRDVDLTGAMLSEDKLTIIRELGYGSNAKLMLGFTGRPWEAAPLKSSGSVITDVGELQTTWATSRGQDGDFGILTNFVGGNRGIAMGDGTPESQAQMALPWIETVFPGTSAKYAGMAVRQHWPSFPHTKGSYASYKKGQWAFFGNEGKREGNQHFCGEHCSEDFQGYMEGGAETGALVAAEILDDLGVRQPPILAGLIGMTATGRARASYHAGFGKRMRLAQIRKRRYR